MRARAVDEPNRASTQLELFFDLTFVVAVAAVVMQLAHGLAEGHVMEVSLPGKRFVEILEEYRRMLSAIAAFDTILEQGEGRAGIGQVGAELRLVGVGDVCPESRWMV